MQALKVASLMRETAIGEQNLEGLVLTCLPKIPDVLHLHRDDSVKYDESSCRSYQHARLVTLCKNATHPA